MIFTQNHPTLQRGTGTSSYRVELLRTPIEKILSILSLFDNLRARQRYLHTPGTSILWYKITISTFFLIPAPSQTTNEILHKNVSNHTDVFCLKTSEKVEFLEKKVCPNPRHIALCGAARILPKSARF